MKRKYFTYFLCKSSFLISDFHILCAISARNIQNKLSNMHKLNRVQKVKYIHKLHNIQNLIPSICKMTDVS